MIDNIGISKLTSVYMHPQLILLGLTSISVSLMGLSRPLKALAPFLPLTTYDTIGLTRVGVGTVKPALGNCDVHYYRPVFSSFSLLEQ